MKRPPIFPAPQFPPVKLRAFQRMPPAVFPVIMGLFGLGLALRRGADAIGYPVAIAEVSLGAISLLWVFATLGYAVKLSQRPAVIMEDLAILPGRAGLAAMSLGMALLAVTLLPYSTRAAGMVMFAALATQLLLAALIILALRRGPAEGRDVTPVWHLSFVGFIIPAVAAAPLGYTGLATGILFSTTVIAIGIWGISLFQLSKARTTRTIAPVACDPPVAGGLVWHCGIAVGDADAGDGVCGFGRADFACDGRLGALDHRVLGFRPFGARSPFRWPPMPVCFWLLVVPWGKAPMGLGGIVVLTAAIGIVPAIALKVLQAWTKGTLAAKTNAATA